MSTHSTLRSTTPEDMLWNGPLRYPWIYLAAIFFAEIATGLYLYWGVVAHFSILVALMVHSSFVTEKKLSNLLTAMTIAPLIRILSLSTPVAEFSQVSWFMIISIPVFVAAFTVAHLQDVSPRDMYINWPSRREIPLDIGILVLAFPIGLLEYAILQPTPMVEFNFQALLAPALIFIVYTGFLEEVIFRGLMQHVAERLAGFAGIVFVSVLFGVLHTTNLAFWDVLLAGSVGFLFAMVVRKTHSIFGISLAHGMVNITLFLIAPHLFSS